MVKELLQHDIIIDAINNKGMTSLHFAVYSGNLDVVQLLIENGAKVEMKSYREYTTPLHIACQRNFKDIAKLLIENGADVNAGNILKRTPLHMAAENGRVDLGELLIRANVNVNSMDHHGWTPLHVAEYFGHRNFQELLVQKRAKDEKFKLSIRMKELPSQPWHGDLWDDFIHSGFRKRVEDQRYEDTWKYMERKIEFIRSGNPLSLNNSPLPPLTNKHNLRSVEFNEFYPTTIVPVQSSRDTSDEKHNLFISSKFRSDGRSVLRELYGKSKSSKKLN
jgi:ankyrin repeat protein